MKKKYLWLFDSKSNLIDCNEEVLFLIDKTREELIGNHLSIFLVNTDLDNELIQFKQLLKSGQSFSKVLSIKLSKKDSLRLVANSYKMGTGFAIMGEEMVEPVVLKEEIPDYRLNMDLIAQKSPDIFLLVDSTGKILYTNRTVSGAAVEEVIGTSAFAYLSNKDANIMKSSIEKVFKTGKPDTYEISATFFEDEVFYFDSRVAPVIKDGKIEAFAITTRNKTAIKRLIKEAEINKTKYLELLMHTGASGFIQDKKLRYTQVFNPHPAFKEKNALGKTDDELLLDKDNVQILTETKLEVLKKGAPIRKDIKIMINGTAFYYDLSVSPLFDSKGDISGIRGISYDITKYKETIFKINKQIFFLEKITDTLPSIAAIYSLNKKEYTFMNIATKRILGYSKMELLQKRIDFASQTENRKPSLASKKLVTKNGKGLASFIHPEDFKGLVQIFKKIYNSKASDVYEVRARARHKSGHWVWLNFRIVAFSRDKKGVVTQTLGIATDISQIKKAELEGKKAMMEGQEKERQRIAADLHDAVNPLLSTTKLTLESLERKFKQTGVLEKIRIVNAVELLNKSMSEVKGIVNNLSPPVLKDFGLPIALSGLCEKITETDDLQIVFDTHGLKQRFDEKIEITLFRIAQELLHNVIKHAAATLVELQLVEHKNSIVLMISDDGEGMNPIVGNKYIEGYGFKNIKNRLATFEGKMEVDSTIGKGTIITIELPF